MPYDFDRVNAVSVTRAGIIVCGVFGLVTTSFMLLPSFGEETTRILWHFNSGLIPPLVGMMIAPAISIAISWLLIARSDEIAQKVFPDDHPVASGVERAMYRVMFTGVGVLVLSGTIPQFVRAFGLTINEQFISGEIMWAYEPIDSLTLFNLPFVIAFAFQFAIGTYLVCGAPHLVRWQLKRSK